jgi:flagellar basal body L-ring protein FlgH
MRNTVFEKLFLGLLVLAFSGCADLLQNLRQESAAIDAEAGEDQDRKESADSDSDNNSDRPARMANRLSGPSAKNVPEFSARGYGRKLASLEDRSAGPDSGAGFGVAPQYRRVTRKDFIDSDSNENSLWEGQGQTNYLFANNRKREMGDLITVDVERELKREIQYQLWMTLPPDQRRPVRRSVASADKAKPDAAGAEGATPPATAAAGAGTDQQNRDAAEEAAKTNLASSGKEDDSVRMEVAENMGNGLLRVVGQKRVIYRGQARLMEITALVNNKDIDDINRVKSAAFLDMKAQVIQ